VAGEANLVDEERVVNLLGKTHTPGREDMEMENKDQAISNKHCV